MRYLVLGDNKGLGLSVIYEIEKRGYTELSYLTDNEVKKKFNEKKLQKYIEDFGPDVIIDLYEDNDIMKAELNDYTELNCYKANVYTTRAIAESANKLDAKLIYLSSDHVYSSKEGYNKESDKLDSLSNYGATKIMGEYEACKCPKCFIVRPGMIYGGKTDTMDNVLWATKPVIEETLEIVSPTRMGYLASIIADMSLNDNYGIYNVADKGRCTKKEFAESIRNIYNKNLQVKASDRIEYYNQVNRALDTTKLKENGYEEPEFWMSSLTNYHSSYGKEKKKVLKKQK